MVQTQQKPNRNLWEKTADNLYESGENFAKATGRAVVSVLNPFAKSPFEGPTPQEAKQMENQRAMQKEMAEAKAANPNATDLDLKYLEEKYMKKDQEDLDLQRRLFQRIKNQEEEVWELEKKEKAEKERAEEEEKLRQRQQEEEERQQMAMDGDAGKGKADVKLGQAAPKANVEATRYEVGKSKKG